MQSRYWRINYGPEAFAEETLRAAGIIDTALKRIRSKGIVLDALLYILKSEDPNDVFTQHSADADDWKHVVALVRFAEGSTAWNLRMLITTGNTKHTALFNTKCRYEALQQTQFEQLLIEFESGRL